VLVVVDGRNVAADKRQYRRNENENKNDDRSRYPCDASKVLNGRIQSNATEHPVDPRWRMGQVESVAAVLRVLVDADVRDDGSNQHGKAMEGGEVARNG
jgi:hypothetical protein